MVNGVAITLLITFFVCAQVYPRQTAITVVMILGFVFATPFMAGLA